MQLLWQRQGATQQQRSPAGIETHPQQQLRSRAQHRIVPSSSESWPMWLQSTWASDGCDTALTHSIGELYWADGRGLVEECSSSSWRAPLKADGFTDSDIIVALGKFDALHLGHRALAAQAAHMGGSPCLLSFSGMAEVLGWPIRQPLVAACDRPRVLKSWELACLGRTPRQRSIPFHDIRTMSPEEFVRVLALDLKAAGVVAGSNYRFGYKAAGDAAALRQLGSKYGMNISIVNLLEDPDSRKHHQQQQERPALGQATRSRVATVAAASSSEVVQHCISSTKARELLSHGDVGSVSSLLGRQYRLVACLDPEHCQRVSSHCDLVLRSARDFPAAQLQASQAQTVLPARTFLNLAPAPGVYDASLTVSVRELDGSASRSCFGTLPLELESGAGMPLQVQLAPDGLHLNEEALNVALSAALGHELRAPGQTLCAVIDFFALVALH